MNIEQIYTGCLAQGAYYIESNGEVAIIDPLREVQSYIDRAKADNAKITYIFETHFHADFVSGHLTLSKETGAPIIYGPTANPDFEAIIATDGQEFSLGNVKIQALHTPGHTMESTTYLLKDEEGIMKAIFTGDTLFLGDVGRPDLAQRGTNMTKEDLAATLYKSLREKIMTLPDEITVYPGHGAGSACGKNMMKETVDTLGHQKEVNYALREEMTEEQFVKEVTAGLTEPPAYFPKNVAMNKGGYDDIEEVIERGTTAYTPEQFERIANDTDAIVLDVRHQDEFEQGFIPRSVFIGLDGGFAPWVGALIKDVKQAILLVVDENRVEEAVTRLSRVGFDNTLGYLKGGFKAWKRAGKEVDFVRSVSAREFYEKSANTTLPVFDVRKDGEYQLQHVKNAHHTPLNSINSHLSDFPDNEDFYIHCAGGYRSMIAASILKSRGVHNLKNISGGFNQMKETGITTEQ